MKRVRYKSKATEQDFSCDYSSESQLPVITRKQPPELPNKRRRTYFFDDVTLSEDYIKISER